MSLSMVLDKLVTNRNGPKETPLWTPIIKAYLSQQKVRDVFVTAHYQALYGVMILSIVILIFQQGQ